MKLTITFLTLAVALPILAMPTPSEVSMCRKRRLGKRCDITGCIASLALTVPPCATAAAGERLNHVADADCVIALGEAIENFGRCSSCFPDPDTNTNSVLSAIENFLGDDGDGSEPGEGDGGIGGGDGGDGSGDGGDGGGDGGDGGGDEVFTLPHMSTWTPGGVQVESAQTPGISGIPIMTVHRLYQESGRTPAGLQPEFVPVK
ncbi:hypothetical protein BD410DRAFT_856978 [Rickenella mellea]|uniref:Fungal calcium binding protein domain-containing protein n=1 Tax=Rickenella mellea TaxID=50990 RepID=A0A4Y7PIU1_9AGAM|nr:hypothetical protein BD410DRAFT_856978 [Rickenella mellea]